MQIITKNPKDIIPDIMEKDIDKVRQFCINADEAAAKIGL